MFYRKILTFILLLFFSQITLAHSQDADIVKSEVEEIKKIESEAKTSFKETPNELPKEVPSSPKEESKDLEIPQEIKKDEDKKEQKPSDENNNKDETKQNSEDNESPLKKINESEFTSLMFSDKEYRNLRKALSSLVNKIEYSDESPIAPINSVEEEKKEEKSERSYVYLASLLFFSQNSWVVWINDRKITSDNNDPQNEFYIKDISKNSVDIVWKLGITKWKIITGNSDDQLPEVNSENQIVNNFTLRPNQTYILVDDHIVEGKISVGNSSKKDTSKEKSKDSLDPFEEGGEEYNFF